MNPEKMRMLLEKGQAILDAEAVEENNRKVRQLAFLRQQLAHCIPSWCWDAIGVNPYEAKPHEDTVRLDSQIGKLTFAAKLLDKGVVFAIQDYPEGPVYTLSLGRESTNGESNETRFCKWMAQNRELFGL